MDFQSKFAFYPLRIRQVQRSQPLGRAHIGPGAGVQLSTDAALGDGRAQQRCQRRFQALRVAGRDVTERWREQVLPVQADGGLGEAPLRLVQRQASVAKAKIAVWVVRRVGNEP